MSCLDEGGYDDRDPVTLTRVTPERRSLHWPEYAIEAAALGTFMVSAAVFATALYHPSSSVAADISNEWLRRSAMGLAMALTAVAIIYSPWGQRSSANMNAMRPDAGRMYVVDASLFVSSGAVNPALTIMANALRVGDHLLERLGARSSAPAATAH